MVRKWERHKTAPGEPTLDTTKYEPVFEVSGRRRSGEGHRFISICTMQGLQPADGVKHGRPGMAIDKLRPTHILGRIHLVESHHAERIRLLLNSEKALEKGMRRMVMTAIVIH